MPLTGPILLQHYVPLNQVAPEPDLSANPDVSHGQVFVCAQTGRMWLVGSVTGGSSRQFRQVLPHVRNADNTVGTRVTNSNGTLSVSSAVGAGEINMFGNLRVNADGIRSPVTGVWVGGLDQYVVPSQFESISLEDSDETLSTDPQAPTSLYLGNNIYNGTSIVQYSSETGTLGAYLIMASLHFTHPNQYRVSVAIEAVNTSSGNFYPVQVASVESRSGPMQVSLTCSRTFIGLGAGQYDAWRIRAYASVAGVVHAPYDAAGSWVSQPPFSGNGQSPNAQYRSRVTAFRFG